MKATISAMSAMLAVCILGGAWAGTWYVDGSVPKPGDGTSWEKALRNIQAGIDKAANGDTVIVAQGKYVENINFGGKNIVLRSTDTTNWGVVRSTVIDGNQAGSVVTFAGTEDETCAICGFTIQNGSGTPYSSPAGGTSLGGGGIYGGLWSGPRTRATLENNIVAGNTAQDGGGIIACDGLTQNSLIVGNAAGHADTKWHGGGIFYSHGIIQNNLVAGNSGGCGGGMSHCNAVLRNNIVVGNSGTVEGGGISHLGRAYQGPAGGSMTNCIVRGNTCGSRPEMTDDCVAPTYSCIKDWTSGGLGNMSGNPRFVDPDGPDDDPATYEDNDYRLLPNSPCIDAGINEDWMNGAVDLDGNPRILLGATSITVDMGAYEFKFCVAGITLTSPAGSPELRWHSRQRVRYGVWSCTDLAAAMWNSVATVTSAGDETTWTDSDAASMLKFYRVEIK